MKNELVRSLVACCAFAGLVCCGGVTQIVGDSPSTAGAPHIAGGAGGAEAADTGGASGALQTAGNASVAGGPPLATCEGGCPNTHYCLSPIDGAKAECLPMCDNRGAPDWGQTCHIAPSGGMGVCEGFFDHVNGTNHLLAMCSEPCNPLASECPAGYSCDLVLGVSDSARGPHFGCLPLLVTASENVNAPCQPFSGYCAPGLTCPNEQYSTCKRFCDLSTGTGCAAGEACRVSAEFPVNGPVGLCLPGKLSG